MHVNKVYTKVQGKMYNFFSGYRVRCNHDLCFVCLSPAMAYRTKTPVSTLQVLLVQNSIFYYFLNIVKLYFAHPAH